MHRPPIRVLDISGSAEQRGNAHGSRHAAEIRRYADERIGLVAAGAWSGGPLERADVLAIAESMLPAHEAFDADLYVELCALAAAADLTPAEAVVVGGFTDFVDTVRAEVGGPLPATVAEDDCTAVIVPDHRADGAGFLGQTWDMHDTATDHVLLLRIEPDDDPPAIVFTTTGCLGQIGMNAEGVCVGINNLSGLDGTRGVAWTSVVRGMLKTSTAAEALGVLLDADLAGAHNYLIFDRHGAGYNVEAFPSARPVTELGDAPVVHTNHAIDPAAEAVQADKDAGLLASSRTRRELAGQLLSAADASADAANGTDARTSADRGDPVDVDRLMALTREPSAICQTSVDPFHIETSGAAIMRPGTGDFWACWGRPADNEFAHFALQTTTASIQAGADG